MPSRLTARMVSDAGSGTVVVSENRFWSTDTPVGENDVTARSSTTVTAASGVSKLRLATPPVWLLASRVPGAPPG